MRTQSKPSGSLLALTFALVVGCFVSSTIYSEFTESAIHERSLEIAENAMPSIEHLATVRAELRHLQILADDYATTPPERSALRGEVEQALSLLLREFEAYRVLPTFPGEATFAAGLRLAVGRVSDATGRLLGTAAGQAPEQALNESQRWLHPAVEQASDEAYQLIAFNAEKGHGLALEIETTRRRALRTALGLDALSAALSFLAGVLLWRILRFYMNALEAQKGLLEQRADELEAFAGRVAHDILNPLSASAMCLDLLRRDDPRLDKLTLVDRGRNALVRAQRIVDALLGFARAGAHPVPGARCEARSVLGDVVGSYQEQAAAQRASLTLAEVPAVEVSCHPGVLSSVVGNLVGNALKYLGEVPVREVAVRAREVRGMLRVEVEDTGPGVPPELGQTLFEPYVRGNRKNEPGIGLGLATVKKLCEAHGGEAGFRSQVGQGSTFWVELPLVR